ncbi:GGDEF domain-containing protein [Paenibacillus thalictri]|uniref:GGDEF domain-containing protein n=1 Tax=Paenibacillus thalictri TaxID=2527873 RepID=A0A4Q9DL55_9BACL|nr:GGDEF domain-containing protein [Paenibacillus thalictri]TBL73997.1 GGDEF domain-containing protein [Paenibacillus thalictri]
MDDFIIPLSHACTLVTLNYIALKIRNRLFIESYEWLAVPLLTGLASIIMIMLPSPGGVLPSDLRFVPIVMAGLRYGFGLSLLSVIIPSSYIVALNEPHIIPELLHGLLLPALVSAMFHKSGEENSGFYIRWLDGLKVCVLLSLTRAISEYAQTSMAWEPVLFSHFMMFLLSFSSITVLIYMYNDENKNWMLQRQLELQANQDGLTKLPNIRSFLNIADNTLKRRKMTIMMIDIDNFKMFNDRYGHLVGDELLRHVGKLLRATIDEQDYVARYGGEEFIIMSQETDAVSLAEYAYKLCGKVSSTPFESEALTAAGGEDKPHVTISVGISTARRNGGELIHLISEADEALYVSKRTGKNKYSFYDSFIYAEQAQNASEPSTL